MLLLEIPASDDGPLQRSLSPNPEDLGLDAEMFRDVQVEVRLERQQQQALLTFEARATARLECDRTLKLFDQPIRGSYHLLVVPPDDPQAAYPDDSVFVLPDASDTINIADPVRDTLLLAIPMRRIAPDAVDSDVPTTFGALLDEDGESIDPRWDALRRLQTEAGDDRPD